MSVVVQLGTLICPSINSRVSCFQPTMIATTSNSIMDKEEDTDSKALSSPHLKSYPDCFGLPYQDHNYGAPPPPSPPNTAAIPPTIKEEPTIKQELIIEEHPPIPGNNIEILQEDDSVTRCICEFDHDDGYMISCDKCFVWQHVDCMGLDRENIPDDYLCELCEPRQVDRPRARLLQKRRRQELADLSPSFSSDSDSSRETIYQRKKKSSVQRNLKDEISGVSKSYKRKRKDMLRRDGKRPLPMVKATPIEATKRPEKKRHPQKSRKRRILSEEEEDDEEEDISNRSPSRDVKELRSWIDDYENVVTNHYSPELRARLTNLKLNGGNCIRVLPEITHCCKVVQVEPNVMGLWSHVALSDGDSICEIQGKYLLLSQWLEQNPQGSNFYQPYLVFYTLPKDGTEVCVDARSYGNLARFVRRSCQPNAKVRHFLDKGSLHLYLEASCSIEPDSEITIPHDSKAAMDSVPCACGSPDCHTTSILKRNGLTVQKRRKRVMRLRSTSGEDDADTGFVENNTANPELELSSQETILEMSVPEKKKTREERKMEAIMKTIEKLERQELKKQEQSKRKEGKKRSGDKSPSSADECHKTRLTRKKIRRTTAKAKLSLRSRINSGSSDLTSADESATQLSSSSCETPQNAKQFKFPKTKKMMMNDWFSEPINRRRSSTKDVVSPPKQEPSTTVTSSTGVGSAKKRWLRQAISEENRPESPSSTDCGTPLKKRRLARESVGQDSPVPTEASCDSVWDSIALLSTVATQEMPHQEEEKNIEEDDSLKDEEMQSPKRKLSILEYRKRKQEVSVDSKSLDSRLCPEEGVQRRRYTTVLQLVEPAPSANNELKYLQGESSWDSNPTLAERQRENLSERLRKEFKLFPDSA